MTNNKQESETGLSKVLAEFCTDLNVEAAEGRLDPVIGRSKEILEIFNVLGRRRNNNPIIVGPAGSGKTALIYALAQAIQNGTAPARFKGKRVALLDLAKLLAGTQYRGQMEERLKKVLAELTSDHILAIDEIHTIVGLGASEGAMDAANLLKPALANGLHCIGTTTLDEYRKRIEKDAALVRRFGAIYLQAPNVSDTIEILRGLKAKYEEHHGLKISDAALKAAAVLSDRYITQRELPDKAISLLDDAASALSNDVVGAETVLEVLPEHVAAIVTRDSGVPLERLTESESDRLLRIPEILHQRVIGQEEAITAVSKAMLRGRSGLSTGKRPIASLMFLGPTGVGKTELAKALSDAFFGSEEQMIRLDMSEYMERHTVSKLIGSPPGYVGYEDAGQLTEAVRRRPYSVVLFDEIEKAHPDVFNLFLQILDDGRLTDSRGVTVDFTNTLIIFTSNVGSSAIAGGSKGGGIEIPQDKEAKSQSDYERMRSTVSETLKQHFRPEFINRLTDVVIFHQLTREQVRNIIDLLLAQIGKAPALVERSIGLQISEAAKDVVLEEGFSETYGARELRRAITRLIEDKLAEALVAGTFNDGSNILVDRGDAGDIVLRQAA